MAILLYIAVAVLFGGVVAVVLNGAENDSRPRRPVSRSGRGRG